MADPVLLVHGFASSFDRNWRQPGWVDLLADAGREVIGVDLLGHGEADKPHDPAAYADLEGDVAAALPDEGQVDAIGFSLGARVLLGVAIAHPDRFARIVLGGLGANLFSNADPEAVASAIESGAGPEAPGIARMFAQFAEGSGNDPKALAACLRRTAPRIDPGDLAAVRCPVLVVLGTEDFAGPGEPLVDALPDATLVVLPGVDHFAAPRDFGFIDAALGFLDALPG